MSRVKLLLAAAIFVSGFYTDQAILPYLFSTQQAIDPVSLSGTYDASRTTAEYLNRPVTEPSPQPETVPETADVLGVAYGAKHIEVDLTNQRLYAFEGIRKVYDFAISSGKWYPTPTGTFRIWIKLRYANMSGGSKELGTYYNLPNVPYTMYFANDDVPPWRGFGIHGTYWHSNFGHPMSHGCINMKTEEVAELYYWADPVLGDKPSIRATKSNPGTPVIIYGETPST